MSASTPTIVAIDAMMVLDSRGIPTVRAWVRLSDGTLAVASAPSGKSKGKAEKAELRDAGRPFGGRGVGVAVEKIRGPIAGCLAGHSIADPAAIDRTLVDLDGSDDRSNLGANAMVAVSMAVWRAAAASRRQPLWKALTQPGARANPIPLFNVINGGAHASGGLRLQEFMLVPHGFKTAAERIRCGAEIYAELRNCFSEAGMSTTVGDEGGFVFTHGGVRSAIALLRRAIERAGYAVGEQVSLAIDAAANSFCDAEGIYSPEPGLSLTTEQMCSWWTDLVDNEPIVMLEDPLDEDDPGGWRLLTHALGSRVILVGDDIFVTDAVKIKRAVRDGLANAALLKVNQIGTVSETFDAWREAKAGSYQTVVSHRSGETCDSFISDLATGIGSEYIKSGAPARSERVEKYNRLLEIEREMEDT